MAYRNGNRDQITLLPDSVDDYVSHDDPVRAYDAFIDCLDLNGQSPKEIQINPFDTTK